jgi:hypothetical protein
MLKLIKGFREQSISLIVSAAVFVAYFLVFRSYFPNAKGALGHDYMQQLPNLLTGYYWYQNNGFFSIPWFSPSQCGGVPFYPDAGYGFFSLPQLLVLFFTPTLAIKITFFAFAFAGYTGFFLLLKRKFRVNQHFAVLGSTLFLFNGFYAHRMIIGHPFHAYMLLPYLAIVVLPEPSRPPRPLVTHIQRVAIGGVIIAYMFQSAMVHIIPPVILAICAVILIYSFLHGRQRNAWLRLGAAIALALGLSSSKLFASLTFLEQFPRDYYSLPGFPKLFDALSIVAQSLFTRPPVAQATNLIAHLQWAIEQHELEFGVTPLPLIIILFVIVFNLFKKKPGQLVPSKRVVAYAGAIAVLLFIPVAVNLYQPGWNAFLKSIPIIKSSSMLIRWFSMYIPVAILAAVLLADATAIVKRYAVWVGVVSIVLVIGYQAREDRTYYKGQTYDSAPVNLAYQQSKSSGAVVPIREIAIHGETASHLPLVQNNLMVAGLSEMACYDAVFGYRLEWLPLGDLHVGPALEIHDGHFNVKNPACYLFPQENNCISGDHFRVEQQTEAERFLQYRPFAFQKSSLQKVADVTNLFFLLLLGAALIYSVFILAIAPRELAANEIPIKSPVAKNRKGAVKNRQKRKH